MPWLSGYAGLDNYAKMGGDPRFWNSLWLTFIYTGSTVLLQIAVGLALALLVLRIPKGQGVLRVAAILPIVLAPVVVGLFWRTLVLAPDVGLVDLVTQALGLGSYNWLGDPRMALISVIAIHTWQWTPFAFLVLLATLSTLPEDIYEAARLDRAGPWQRFLHITLPLIRPAIAPLEGASLRPAFNGDIGESEGEGEGGGRPPMFWEHEGNAAVRIGKWKLVRKYPGPWELYDMDADRTELHDLSATHPERVRDMAARYEEWARRCGVIPREKILELMKQQTSPAFWEEDLEN
jgi:ABC-type molybdate transport system permease subunit